ncbi:hypothetical protein IAQ61_001042 [Plenodomus lingam]|uniref:Predicted protein n=1 Tax=Leptosphaeria maculans (strain JN3 / isolate v23.1.3 / race Av1-4-5-6-7-8) TaxID=985895 RepID=E5A239_LEPMJ|nr:predicted protein [Plenodomus lingam JN3]KAH9880748.1 hypothetical protein IAQ61_001042 [Plenodomus lingam]CBX97756.1 predicted protein [Plenodomus lingam JN3]
MVLILPVPLKPEDGEDVCRGPGLFQEQDWLARQAAYRMFRLQWATKVHCYLSMQQVTQAGLGTQ